jgi:hypothetical protein
MKNADPNRNLILGRKPTFGDTEQIAYVQRMSKIHSLTEKHGGPITEKDVKGFEQIKSVAFHIECRICKKAIDCEIDDFDGDEDDAIDKYFIRERRCPRCESKYKMINGKVMITHVVSND